MPNADIHLRTDIYQAVCIFWQAELVASIFPFKTLFFITIGNVFVFKVFFFCRLSLAENPHQKIVIVLSKSFLANFIDYILRKIPSLIQKYHIVKDIACCVTSPLRRKTTLHQFCNSFFIIKLKEESYISCQCWIHCIRTRCCKNFLGISIHQLLNYFFIPESHTPDIQILKKDTVSLQNQPVDLWSIGKAGVQYEFFNTIRTPFKFSFYFAVCWPQYFFITKLIQFRCERKSCKVYKAVKVVFTIRQVRNKTAFFFHLIFHCRQNLLVFFIPDVKTFVTSFSIKSCSAVTDIKYEISF